MRINVDRVRCENHGQCALVAPEIFRMNSEGVLEYEDTAENSQRPEAEEAADLCPVQAIFIDQD
jgi:ferredoxin